jgi:hypothetical protein
VDLYCSLRGDGDSVAYYFDPTLADYVALKGIESINYVERRSEFSSSLMQINSRRCAVDFENKISEIVKEYTKVSNVIGWQYLTLRYFFLNYFWYYGLWDEALHQIPEGEVNIFVNNNPHYLNQHSYLPSVLLMQRLSSIGREYKAYLYGEVNYGLSDVLDVVDHQLERDCDLLAHLPTIIHDATYVESELSEFKSIINIKSKYWDTSIASAIIDIGFVKSEGAEFYNEKFLNEILFVEIDGLLSKYFSAHDFRKRQVELFVNVLNYQLKNYHLLNHYFSKHKPKRLLISDHDAGLHGPILKYCNDEEIDIYVFPHSKFLLDNGFKTRKTTYLNHSIQRSITCIHAGAKLKSNLIFPDMNKMASKKFASKNIKSIGLILNGLSEGGILTLNFEKYLNGIKILSDWCSSKSIIVKIRCRPDMPVRSFLNNLFIGTKNVTVDSYDVGLTDFISKIDLCVMYDIPTSASISILDSNCPLINILPAELDFWISGWVDEDVVPFYDIASGVAKLNDLLSTLDVFLENQQAEYKHRISKSKSLSAVLIESNPL